MDVDFEHETPEEYWDQEFGLVLRLQEMQQNIEVMVNTMEADAEWPHFKRAVFQILCAPDQVNDMAWVANIQFIEDCIEDR